MKNIPERYKRKFSKDEINDLPLSRYEGTIEIVRDEETLADALPYLHQERVLGFDTETRPTFRKGKVNLPSLVQFATSDRVFLIQLNWIPLNDVVCDILNDAGTIKTGVAVRDDIKDLQKLRPFTDNAVVDLGEIARELNLETHGLRNLAANFLGVRISKGAQCSNWANKELTQQQVAYAATDAWISREIHLSMEKLGLIKL